MMTVAHSFRRAVFIGFIGLGLVACNTTKATVDSTVKFFSSTSPESMFNRDGILEDSYKLDLYAMVAYDNLQQDLARGNGEYLTSLGVLLEVPKDRQVEWRRHAQNRFSAVFPEGTPPSAEVVTRLNRELGTVRQ